MHEDLSVKTTLSLAAFFSYFAGLPAEVVMGSLMGAIYFITAATGIHTAAPVGTGFGQLYLRPAVFQSCSGHVHKSNQDI
ncbi:hypothetical protein [Morganella morganii]|uniref:hypothetical protein n=1 Tax=Morganella morganii TaxID=582 RepID=UPI0032DB4236